MHILIPSMFISIFTDLTSSTISLIKIPNMVGDYVSPCFTLQLVSNHSVIILLTLIEQIDSWYIALILSYI